MDQHTAMQLRVNAYTSDADLNLAWRTVGQTKLDKRTSKNGVTYSFRQLNRRIDEIWDEMLRRQLCPSYYRHINAGTEPGESPKWNPEKNFLRGYIPGAFDRIYRI